MRESRIRSEFESYINENAPAFFDRSKNFATRLAAFNRVLGTPDALLNTPQDRLLFTVPYQSGTTVRTYNPDIPKSLYSHWILRLAGQYTKTEGAAGTLATEGPLPLISGFRVNVDGEAVKEIDLTHLRVISHHIYRGADTNLTNVTLGSDTAEDFSARVALDFRTLRSERPDATYFPANRYNQLSVEVDWASISAAGCPALIGGGTYTVASFATAPTLQIWGKEILNPGKQAKPYWLQRYSQKVFSVSSQAQTAGVFQLPVGEVIRGILISQYTNSPRLPISTLVTANANIVLRANGNNRKYETTWVEQTQRNQADYGVALPTGYVFLDFMDADNGGLYETAFDTGQIQSLEALVDTASVASAFLQFTLVTFKPARNF
jgi:hypothetical protein